MSKKDNLVWLLIILYIIGGFLTNSYMQEYRWEDWELMSIYQNNDEHYAKIMFGTIGWPIYWISIFSTMIVRFFNG